MKKGKRMTDELKQWEYDRGYDKGKLDGAREFAKWCEEKGYFDDYDSHTADNLLSWWQKGAENV